MSAVNRWQEKRALEYDSHNRKPGSPKKKANNRRIRRRFSAWMRAQLQQIAELIP